MSASPALCMSSIELPIAKVLIISKCRLRNSFIESKVEFMEKSSGVAPRILIFNGFSCLFFLSFTDFLPAGTSSLAIVSIAIPAPFT